MAILTSRNLEYPFTSDKVRTLKVGELVTLSGHVFTARDRLHKYLHDGGKAPVTLKDGALYHCGPVVLKKEGAWVVRAAGPTTSLREEPYMPKIIQDHQVRVIIGKGGMGLDTEKACAEFGCVFLQAVGGAGQMLAEKIVRVDGVYFLDEFGPTEALWDLIVKDFPALVAVDTAGRSLYRRVEAASRAAMRRLLKSAPFRG